MSADIAIGVISDFFKNKKNNFRQDVTLTYASNLVHAKRDHKPL